MKKDSKSLVRWVLIGVGIIVAAFVAYKIYQYVMMYMVGKAVMGTASEAFRFAEK